ncbi:nitroreductase [Halalkaliarchaeum desulfuricum]|uniref:Nitroreductase n=1 Tax=Halalkaliarchaeum desulfuricum TaxID=2055893 RepID=A0A343TLT6_9EURY|nr:SagB/ThcOx family dehydrogenase [Halalkaliarchaeum desulfuricum]AUX10058.1 nitroreductase [Halalkaliarchaeum desulfuricum]
MEPKSLPRRAVVGVIGLVGAVVVADLAHSGFGVLHRDQTAPTDTDDDRSDDPVGVAELAPGETVSLPGTVTDGDVSVERALENRRSRREFGDEPLETEQLSQLLWAAQGITDARGYRTAPSAGAQYPLELYVVIGQPGVEGLDPGVYRYLPDEHRLEFHKPGSVQAELRSAAADQRPVETAAIDVVICAVDERTTDRYGQRGKQRYVPMEAGHVGQNLYLQTETLDLATVAIGAFSDGAVREVIGASEDERPLYVFPIGMRV